MNTSLAVITPCSSGSLHLLLHLYKLLLLLLQFLLLGLDDLVGALQFTGYVFKPLLDVCLCVINVLLHHHRPNKLIDLGAILEVLKFFLDQLSLLLLSYEAHARLIAFLQALLKALEFLELLLKLIFLAFPHPIQRHCAQGLTSRLAWGGGL